MPQRFRLIAILFLFLGSISANAGSPIYLGSKSLASVSMDAIDHSKWDGLLKKYVNDQGLVNYKAWKASDTDTKQLDKYISHLSTASLSIAATRPAKLTFFINAYNSVTVKGILNEYPTSSIRKHTAKLFGYNIWHDLQLYVGGTPLSLDAMEHKVLRKLSEPRIHFAIVCASIGCPRLLNEAYVPGKLNEQLERNAKDFFGRSSNFKFDVHTKTFQLSSILDWFGEDFGDSRPLMLKKVSGWLPPGPAQELAVKGEGNVEFLSYDWSLNSQ